MSQFQKRFTDNDNFTGIHKKEVQTYFDINTTTDVVDAEECTIYCLKEEVH
jgi:hypothetical protein